MECFSGSVNEALGFLPIDAKAGPMSAFELRQYILDGIDRMLSHPVFLGLNDQAKMIMRAVRDYWATNDQAIQDVLTSLGWNR